VWRDDDEQVFHVASARLTTCRQPWAFAAENAAAIDAHWDLRRHQQPSFFNGAVLLLANYEVTATGCLEARFLRSDFKSFLFWRETGWPDRTVMDAFGSALIFSRDGHLLVGRQRDGHLNGGLSYPPSGFIDAGDVGADGAIDIDHSVRREIGEELGLGDDQLHRRPGYVVTRAGPVLSIGVPFEARVPDADLMASVARHIAADPDAELAGADLLAPGADTAQLAMPDYARALLAHLPRLISPA
jgi:hypothetical protein